MLTFHYKWFWKCCSLTFTAATNYYRSNTGIRFISCFDQCLSIPTRVKFMQNCFDSQCGTAPWGQCTVLKWQGFYCKWLHVYCTTATFICASAIVLCDLNELLNNSTVCLCYLQNLNEECPQNNLIHLNVCVVIYVQL